EIGTNTAGIAVTYLLDLRTDTEIYVYVSPASSVSGVYLDGSEARCDSGGVVRRGAKILGENDGVSGGEL
ncbi:MAG: hypothetical protein IJL18_01840, partial [Synergistaceae bacterium]|nr:hypothetical protein [Synergistaceae bacterium]